MNSDTLESGLPPANDRMLTTCFMAALFHGVIILGVTFSSSKSDAGGPDSPALEVVLVGDQVTRAAKNPGAHYLAQRTQQGFGNASSSERTLIPDSSPVPLERAGNARAEGLAAIQGGPQSGNDELIATRARSLKILYFAPAAAAPETSSMPEPLEKRPNLGMATNDDGIELRLRGDVNAERWVAADTRESAIAVYLDGWRRKIERVGTMNFPDAARRRKLSGTPVIEVTIGADGSLLNTVIRRSSGHAELDEAAMRILKLAAPYDTFPRELTAQHDEIRIAYEWQFLAGAAESSGVVYADPPALGRP